MRNWSLRHLVIWAIAAAALPNSARAAAPAPAPDVRVKTTVDRTAMWVADRVTYTIELVCRPGVDVLDEDLSRDKLKLNGLQILASDTEANTAADGAITHRYAYTLTGYRVDTPELGVAAFPVRYYVKRPGVRLQDASPAGEVQVPALDVAFRSTLPDQADTAALRDGRSAEPRARKFGLAHPVGLGLVIASFAPALFLVVGMASRQRHRLVHRSARQVRADEEASLDAARSLDLSTLEGRREAYTRINTVVRDHLREACGVPGPSLTPAEIAPALAGKRVPAETVTTLLAECELARFGPPNVLPSADACRDAIAAAEQVLASR